MNSDWFPLILIPKTLFLVKVLNNLEEYLLII